MIEGWVRNKDLRIHYIDNTGPSAETPLIIIPGLTETGREYIGIIKALQPRRALVVTMRGRGESDTPESGYSLEDHVSDIKSVVDHIDIENFVLFGFSRGVSYALGYAVKHPERLSGMIVGDYPAIQADFPEGWANLVVEKSKGAALSNMTIDTLKEIEKDSREVHFLPALKHLNCPVLILRGSNEDTGLSEEAALQYLRCVPDSRVKVIQEEGNGRLYLQSEKLVKTIEQFFNKVKGRN
jgi:pimeloyl-ACP methyl ester carboxylesterase